MEAIVQVIQNAQADANGDVRMADDTGDAGAGTGDAEEGDTAQKTSFDLGDMIPSAMLKNENGEDVETSGLVAQRGVVLFLVPKADTRASLSIPCLT